MQKTVLFVDGSNLYAGQLKNLVFFKGYRSKTSGKEKEVDVKLATDLVHFAHLDVYDHAVFISGDADFMHALLVVAGLGKKVTVVAIQNRISFRFLGHFVTVVACSPFHKMRILRFERLRQFLLPKRVFVSVPKEDS